MSYTLLQLRRELATSIGSLTQGTATGGSTNLLTDTDELGSNRYNADHFNGADIHIVTTTDAAAPQGEVRNCYDHDPTFSYLYVDPVWTAAPESGDTYDLYLKYSKNEFDSALMLAVTDWRLNTTITLSDTAAEYSLSGIGLHENTQVLSVAVRATNDANIEYRFISDWRVWDDAGTLTIEFASDTIDSTLTARIEYTARFDQLRAGGTFGAAYDDARVIGGDLWDHILRAQSQLYRARMNNVNSADFERYASLYRETQERIIQEGKPQRRRPSRTLNDDDFQDKAQKRRYQPSNWWL